MGGGIFSRWGSFRGRLSEINKEEEEKTPKKTGKVFKKCVWGKGGGGGGGGSRFLKNIHPCLTVNAQTWKN